MNQVLVSAGDAWTAKLIQEAGFDGIWISGFEACARLNLPDNGSITMDEMLRICKPIIESVKIPVWVDVDTGYGNFQRTVREFERIGAYGVCVQDDLEGHKTNSLWGGDSPLMSSKDFSKKISVKRNKIKIMARTESLIRGLGAGEALTRLLEYHAAGADYLLPHTRLENLLFDFTDEVSLSEKMNFAIVPTKFPNIKNEDLFRLGYCMVIWANQTERTKIKSIREMLKILKGEDCSVSIDGKMAATLDEMKGLLPDE
jgi:phosphoenolpyruvate phosphomutase